MTTCERTVAVVQVRYDSSRLPGKALAPLGDMPALAWVVRAARAVPQIDQVVVATSDQPSEGPITAWCADNEIPIFRGAKDDVLARMLAAAEAHGAEVVVRLTGDCPLLDPAVCGQLLLARARAGAAYATNAQPSSWPDGLDCEAITVAALRDAAREARLPSEREHVTRWTRANRSRYPQVVLRCPVEGLSGERWTLDTPDDLRFLQAVVAHLDAGRPPSFIEVIDVLQRHPEIPEERPLAPRNAKLAEVMAADFARDDFRDRRYDRSQAQLARAKRSIPTGAQTFSKSSLIFPAGKAPLFASHGTGARIWDVDGNEYVDLISALLPVVLGYADPDVDAAIRDQLNWGISHSVSTELEAELAERIVRIVPSAEAVRFGKNGTDATSAAIRVARSFTGRDRVAVGGYHGWQDWYIATTSRNKGIPACVAELTHRFDPASPDSLRALLESRRGEFATVILEPVGVHEPTPETLQALRATAHEHGALLVFDEVITGFRVAAGGAQAYYGVTPDLTCLGKALGNGMPISALAGREDVMAEYEEVFVSGTFGGEALSLAAAVATLDKVVREDVPAKLARDGADLADHVTELAARYGVSDAVAVSGHPSWKHVVLRDHPHGDRFELRTFLMRRLFDNGVLVAASHNVSHAFSEANRVITKLAYERALADLSAALQRGPLRDSLDCDPIRPVFAVRGS